MIFADFESLLESKKITKVPQIIVDLWDSAKTFQRLWVNFQTKIENWRQVVREKKINLKKSKVTFFIWLKCQFRTF
jgi:hypothetical protein